LSYICHYVALFLSHICHYIAVKRGLIFRSNHDFSVSEIHATCAC
jgi:hypothetical protein